MKQFARQRVQDYIDASAVRFPSHICEKRAVTRIEYMMTWNSKRFYKVLSLVVMTYSCENLELLIFFRSNVGRWRRPT